MRPHLAVTVRTNFLELRHEVAPDRDDVTAWADLLSLDEKRQVPKRVAV